MLERAYLRPVEIQKEKRARLSNRVLILLVLGSATLNIFLAREIQKLDSALLHLKAELSATSELKLGDSVPPIKARDIAGRSVTVNYPDHGSATILYIFTPDCIWCSRNIQNVKALVDQIGRDYNFIGLSLSKDRLHDYVTQNVLNFPVYTELTSETISTYKMKGTPRTLVITPDGRIMKNWFGAYSSNIKQEIEEYFKVSLPGVDSSEKEEPKERQSCDE